LGSRVLQPYRSRSRSQGPTLWQVGSGRPPLPLAFLQVQSSCVVMVQLVPQRTLLLGEAEPGRGPSPQMWLQGELRTAVHWGERYSLLLEGRKRQYTARWEEARLHEEGQPRLRARGEAHEAALHRARSTRTGAGPAPPTLPDQDLAVPRCPVCLPSASTRHHFWKPPCGVEPRGRRPPSALPNQDQCSRASALGCRRFPRCLVGCPRRFGLRVPGPDGLAPPRERKSLAPPLLALPQELRYPRGPASALQRPGAGCHPGARDCGHVGRAEPHQAVQQRGPGPAVPAEGAVP
jgi:hypothetical protein